MDEIEVRDLENSILICRTLGHSWDDNLNAEIDSSFSNFMMALRCTRCHTERFDAIGASGQLFNRYYRYPQGYRTHKVLREEFRKEMVSRSLLIHNYKKRQMQSAKKAKAASKTTRKARR